MKRSDTTSVVTYLIRLYDAIYQDIIIDYPNLSKTLSRDRQRITTLASTRGLPFFVNDLPSLDKLLLAGLEGGEYCSSGEPLTRPRHRRGRIPLFCEGLYLLIFNGDGCLLDVPDRRAIAHLRQIFLCCKKFNITHREEQVHEKVNEFAAIEGDLPTPDSEVWTNPISLHRGDLSCVDFADRLYGQLVNDRRFSDSPDDCRRLSKLWQLTLQKVYDVIATSLGPYDYLDHRFRHGPGAVSDGRSTCYKYANYTWNTKLESIFSAADCAFINHMHWIDELESLKWDENPVSKFIAVPKDYKGPRMIASEPVAHQWCQQNIRDYLATGCHTSWLQSFIDFRDQERNGSAALQGSITGDTMTADLSSASDCVTCAIVERAFRRNKSLLRALAASRTPVLTQELCPTQPSSFLLKKFSTMGSACTFPIESLIFLGIGLASLAISDECYTITKRSLTNYKDKLLVYGDDIVIDKRAWVVLEKLLTSWFFRVNTDKTFWKGNFRESCGTDAYMGYNVTPVRMNVVPDLKSPETLLAVIDSSNNFHKCGYWRAADYLKKTIDRHYVVPVGRMSSGQPVFKSFTGVSVQNAYYHKESCQWRTRGLRFNTKSPKRAQTGLACALQWFTEDPSQDIIWESGANTRARLKMSRKGPHNISDLY